MKNLFAVNKTAEKNATTLDDNPYLAARVSEEVRDLLHRAFETDETDTPRQDTPEEAAMKKKSRTFWIISVVCLVLGFGMLVLGQGQGWYENSPVLHAVDIGLLLVCVVFNFRARRLTQKLSRTDNASMEEDFKEATDRLEEAARLAAEELGVPGGATNLEVLPYHYKITGDKPVMVGKKNHFDNIMVSAFVDGDRLCLASAQELFRVPLDHVRGYRKVDEDYQIDFWIHEEEPDSPRYAAYNIRSAGMFAKKAHGYRRVWIASDQELTTDEGYEILVPEYEMSVLCGLVDLKEIPPET